MNKKNAAIDMTHGPMVKKIILFIIPLMLTKLLQVAFSTADTAVTGRCVGDMALAAVGASAVIMELIIWVSGGLSSGASVVIAQDIGRDDDGEISRGIHTAMLFSLVCGVAFAVIGLIVARPALRALGTPDDVFKPAVTYLTIVLFGIPAQMVYQFGAAAMRAAGDTGKPVLFLAFSGAMNVVLNLFAVLVLHLEVVGVALATTVTQYLSAVLIVRYMCRRTDRFALHPKKLAIHKDKLAAMLKIGIPAAVQGILFTISDIALQTAVNSLGSLAMSGNSVAMTVDGFVFISMDSLTQACMVFSGQNVGAKLYDRSKKAIGECAGLAAGLGIVVGLVVFTFRRGLARLFLPDAPEAVEYALGRLSIVTTTCFIYGVLDVISAALRSYGKSTAPAVISVVGISCFRLAWVLFVFPTHHTMFELYLCYPLAWILCLIAEGVVLRMVIRKATAGTAVPTAG